jgi:predicted transcriptional regulator
MNEPKVTRSVELPSSLNDLVIEIAHRERLSVAAVIRNALTEYAAKRHAEIVPSGALGDTGD